MEGSNFTELLRANKHLGRIGLEYGEFQDSQSVKKEIVDFIPCLKVSNYLKHVTIEFYRKC